MRLVTGVDALVCEWLAKVHGVEVPQQPRLILAVADRDALVGCFVITWRHNRTAELSVFGTVSQETVKQMFRTVFEQCGVYRLEVRTEKTNKKVKKAAPKFGFIFQGVDKDFYGPNQDALVFYMRPNECRWIK